MAPVAAGEAYDAQAESHDPLGPPARKREEPVVSTVPDPQAAHESGQDLGLSSPFGGDSSVGERDLDAGAAEVDHRDERVG
jgi:hypothetical protein